MTATAFTPAPGASKSLQVLHLRTDPAAIADALLAGRAAAVSQRARPVWPASVTDGTARIGLRTEHLIAWRARGRPDAPHAVWSIEHLADASGMPSLATGLDENTPAVVLYALADLLGSEVGGERFTAEGPDLVGALLRRPGAADVSDPESATEEAAA